MKQTDRGVKTVYAEGI